MKANSHRLLSEQGEALDFGRVILPVVTVGTDGSYRPIGTCWIFLTAGRDAFAFSAAHVFEEVVRSECRHERSAASMPDIIRSAKPPAVTLAKTSLRRRSIGKRSTML